MGTVPPHPFLETFGSRSPHGPSPPFFEVPLDILPSKLLATRMIWNLQVRQVLGVRRCEHEMHWNATRTTNLQVCFK